MPRKRRYSTGATGEVESGVREEFLSYQPADGGAAVEVRVDKETVWMSQRQMAALFDKDTDTIGLHIRNTFKEKELEEASTTEDSSVVRREGGRQVRRSVRLYNLDVIISVGYRVKSKRGTQFRIWATRVLRGLLIKGYSSVSRQRERQLTNLRQSLRLVQNVLDRHEVTSDEANALLKVVTDYSAALDLLDDYDHQRLLPVEGSRGSFKGISYEEAMSVISRMREKFGASQLFGAEKDRSLHSSLNTIMQTFGGKDLYPSLEDKAAHLLYFLVKNHSFVDGNKRIAAALFLWCLDKNGALYRRDGSKRLGDKTLVAMTLMVAESDAAQKDAVINLMANLIAGRS